MRKELIFLGILEWREPISFLVIPERLIRIPVTAKTTSAQVYKELEDWVVGAPEAEDALRYYLALVGDVEPKITFFKQQFFIPEEGRTVWAMFNLKTVLK